ncbi:MAG: SGNH/GDSL hydrolase family protein [Acidobacteriota bacterium]|jgi:lysophospholipase L1-like esterase
MYRGKALIILILAAVVAAAPALAQNTGQADFSSFVALGDSLGAGFVSGGLVRGAQEDSVPALLARQATGQTIRQPLVEPPGLPPLLRLASLSPLTITELPAQGPPNLDLDPLHQNLSVPGYDVGDALRNRQRGPADLATFILAAPPSPQPPTMLELALAQQPTFALVWLGNNDVLGAAVSGRVIEGVTLTPRAQFEADYTSLVGALATRGVDLALATIPDVTAIPYVTTIPPIVVDPATNQPVLGPDGNPIPLFGPNGPLPPGSRVLLPASAKLALGIGIPGVGSPEVLQDEDFLSPGEIAAIQNRTNAFNQIIREVANQTGSPVAEINDLLLQGAGGGFDVGGVEFTADFVTGGLISLDGIHPTPLGYALAANEFIRVINQHYGADIELVDLFPFLFGTEGSAIPSIPGASIAGFVYSEGAGSQMRDVFNVGRPSKGNGGPDDVGSAVPEILRDLRRPGSH